MMRATAVWDTTFPRKEDPDRGVSEAPLRDDRSVAVVSARPGTLSADASLVVATPRSSLFRLLLSDRAAFGSKTISKNQFKPF